MTNYGFADGDGNSITRGRQSTLREARRFAQQYANAYNTCVEFWDEDEPDTSLETVEPESK